MINYLELHDFLVIVHHTFRHDPDHEQAKPSETIEAHVGFRQTGSGVAEKTPSGSKRRFTI
jgi:hypothetical protein